MSEWESDKMVWQHLKDAWSLDWPDHNEKEGSCDGTFSAYSRRTKGKQGVLAIITPLGKLGRFEEADNFFSSITISLPSGAIRVNTSS